MRRFVMATVAVATMATAAAALAQSNTPTKPVPATWDWSACKREIDKNCKDVSPKDNEGLWVCLQVHEEDSSKGCDAAHVKYEIETGR